MKKKAILNKLDDQQLVVRFVAGDDACFDMLAYRHKSKIFTTICQIVKDRMVAEDIFQETLIKLCDILKKQQYKEEGKFLPWALRIARNLAIDHFRKEKRSKSVTNSATLQKMANHYTTDDSSENRMIRRESKTELKELINQLPPAQREVLLLRHYNDFSFKEIATFTDVSINTALGRMRYALINLKKLADQHGVAAY